MKKRWKKKWKGFLTMLVISIYVNFYYKNKLKENWILIDSKNGKDLGSNMLRIAEELCHNHEYRSYKIFLSCHKDKKPDIQKMIRTYGLTRVKIIEEAGFKYARVAALAKYLFTDTSFPSWYTKKEGQIITNTWHGTPLKMMGKDVRDRAFDMGNVQKSQLIADYLTYPSDYMKDCMVSAYYLEPLYQGKILCSGYPRNSVFLDRDAAKTLRTKLGLDGMRLYTYMPTWRGNLRFIDSSRMVHQAEYYFAYLEEHLREDEIFFVRLHPFVANSIDYTQYKHIKPFPEGYDPYDILNICDCLVTDYSSVFFDFANAGQKIVLFVYDREIYMDERGVYVSIDSFPFPQVRRVEDLLREMRTPKEYDDSAFVAKYCQYDEPGTAAKLCRHILLGDKQYEEITLPKNGRENVLFYGGNLGKNGLTTALLNLLSHLDTEKRNYFVSFVSSSLRKDPLRVNYIPEAYGLIPIASMTGMSFKEEKAIRKYFEQNDNSPAVMELVDRFFARLYKRNFGSCHLDTVIHYHGYEKNIINMFQQANARRVIFAHNDMVEEIRTKGNQHELTLKRAYHDYDKVVPVTSDIYKPTLEIGGNKDNIVIVNNCHDYQSVIERGQQPIEFQNTTVSNVTLEQLKEILDSDARKIINIGRFSAEKGHDMLLKAFDKYHAKNPNSYLIIIGGYGELYDHTVELAGSLEAGDHIAVIKSVQNPMPILKKCDLFVLSSLYEGLGLVLLEADTLGIPVISTDIVGPQGFMTEHGGYLVEPSVKGLFGGLRAFDRGQVPVMGVDYEAYNQNGLKQFDRLFEGA